MTISLEDIKKHLNIDDDFTDDDIYLLSLVDVAEKIVLKHIDCNDVDDLLDDEGNLPTPLIQAIKLLVGNFYANRESVSNTTVQSMPLNYEYILDLYMDYSKKYQNGGIF